MYVRPSIEDYGDLVSLTADASGLAHFGVGTIAAISTVNPNTSGAGDVAGTQTTGGDDGGTLGAGGSGGGDDGGVAGDSASGGSGGGSGGGGGGAAGKLPFTGFAAALVGVVGAGLAGTGAAARRFLARR
jgi:hypothetical protein